MSKKKSNFASFYRRWEAQDPSLRRWQYRTEAACFDVEETGCLQATAAVVAEEEEENRKAVVLGIMIEIYG